MDEGQRGDESTVTPGPTPAGRLQAVRLAKEALGDATPAKMAAHIKAAFGLEIKPAIVSVLLATLRERQQVAGSKLKAQELIAAVKSAEANAEPPAKRKRAKKADGRDAPAA